MTESQEDGPPPFDQALADSYLGKYILVGITYFSHAQEIVRRDQLHGVIASASAAGIVVELKGTNIGRSWTMPPDLSAISWAKPGRYSLKETGETVEDPDLLCTWSITQPQKH